MARYGPERARRRLRPERLRAQPKIVARRRAVASETLLKRITTRAPRLRADGNREARHLQDASSQCADQRVCSRRRLAQRSGQRIRFSGGDVSLTPEPISSCSISCRSRTTGGRPDADGRSQVRSAVAWVYKNAARHRRRCRAYLYNRPFFRRASFRLHAGHRLAERFRFAGEHHQRRPFDQRHVRFETGAAYRSAANM